MWCIIVPILSIVRRLFKQQISKSCDATIAIAIDNPLQRETMFFSHMCKSAIQHPFEAAHLGYDMPALWSRSLWLPRGRDHVVDTSRKMACRMVVMAYRTVVAYRTAVDYRMVVAYQMLACPMVACGLVADLRSLQRFLHRHEDDKESVWIEPEASRYQLFQPFVDNYNDIWRWGWRWRWWWWQRRRGGAKDVLFTRHLDMRYEELNCRNYFRKSIWFWETTMIYTLLPVTALPRVPEE